MIQELNVNNFDQEINKDKPVVVEFYTTACSHCKKLAGALNKLSEEKGDDVFFGKCNIDQESTLAMGFKDCFCTIFHTSKYTLAV